MSVRVRPLLLSFGVMCALAAMAAAAQATYIDFWTIASYDYNPKEPFEPAPLKATGTIPSEVRALDGRTVEIYGNTMAIDYASGMMSEFILHSSADNCSFGAIPRINEWIYVTMRNGQKARISTALDVKVTGTFQIREQIEDGRVVALYHIVADRVQ